MSNAGDVAEYEWLRLAEVAGDGAWMYFPDGVIHYSPRWAELLGYKPEELGTDPLTWSSRVHPDDLPGAMADMLAMFNGMAPVYRNEHRLRRRDGTWVWVLARGAWVDTAEGRCFVGSHTDITQLKLAELELRQLRDELQERVRARTAELERANEELRTVGARHRALLEALPDMMFRIRRDGTFLDFSAARGDTALPHDRIIGANVSEVFPAALLEPVRAAIARALGSGAVEPLEYTLEMSGHPRDYEARLMRSGPDEVVAIVRDVTDRRRLEERYLQAQKMEGIGRLAGGVAHDFNNLLTVILSYAQMMEEDSGPDGAADMRQVREAAERAAQLTRQLLTFARKQRTEVRTVNLSDLTLGMDKLLRRVLGEDVELVTLPAEGIDPVDVDPGQMEQVIMNLAVNARDAMPEGGRLEIAIRNVTPAEVKAFGLPEAPAGRCVELLVRDTGLGMTADVRARLFEPFFSTKPTGTGSGLGLATCYGIVKQFGGAIWAESEPGKGATFHVLLPKSARDVALEATHSAPRAHGRETVLVIEDNGLVREATVRALRRHGYVVLVAETPSVALTTARSHEGPIDLVLSDVVMPEMSGPEVVERLRVERPDASVLFVSGFLDDSVTRRGTLSSSAAFLAKPFTPADLARKVREVLDTRR